MEPDAVKTTGAVPVNVSTPAEVAAAFVSNEEVDDRLRDARAEVRIHTT